MSQILNIFSNKKAYLLLLFLLLFLTIIGLLYTEESFSTENQKKLDKLEKDYVPGELVVKYKNKTDLKTKKNLYKKLNALKSSKVKNNIEKLKFSDESDIEKIAKIAQKDPNVKYAEPNYLFKTSVIPNDTDYSVQWALSKTNMPSGWDITTGTASNIVAIIDTGVDYNHSDLTGKVIKGWDFINDDPDPMDDYGHGTNIAGIIAANTNNSLGVAGIGWNNNVLAVKSFDSNGLGTTINISQGITYSYSNGAKVLNLSFAGINNSSIIQDEINIARNSYGCVIVACLFRKL